MSECFRHRFLLISVFRGFNLRDHGDSRFPTFSKALEKFLPGPDDLYGFRLYPQTQIFQQLAKVLAVYQVDGQRTVPDGLPFRVSGKASGSDEQSLVRAAGHGSPTAPLKLRISREPTEPAYLLH